MSRGYASGVVTRVVTRVVTQVMHRELDKHKQEKISEIRRIRETFDNDLAMNKFKLQEAPYAEIPNPNPNPITLALALTLSLTQPYPLTQKYQAESA